MVAAHPGAMNSTFLDVVAVIGLLLLAAIAALLALNLRKRNDSPARPNEAQDDDTATLAAWNELAEIDAKFLALEEPDEELPTRKEFTDYASQCRTYGAQTSSLAAEVHAVPRKGVDDDLRDWMLELKEWYSSYADIYHEWASHFVRVAEFERDHTGIWPILEGMWRGAQFDMFSRGNEVSEAQNALLRERDALDKEMAGLLSKREMLLAEHKHLETEFSSRWDWTDGEEQQDAR